MNAEGLQAKPVQKLMNAAVSDFLCHPQPCILLPAVKPLKPLSTD